MNNSLSIKIDQQYTKDTKGFTFGERDVHKFIVETCQNDKETSDEFKFAEWLAFRFAENHNPNDLLKETYYCCSLKNVDKDGNPIEDELVLQITPEMIDYWEVRGGECENPLLKARYLGLVWHFKELRPAKKTSITIAQGFLDALIEIANGDYYIIARKVYPKLEHGLKLAIRIGDTARRGAFVSAIIEFEKRHAEDDKGGTWGKAFDLLCDKKGTILLPEEEQSIISDLVSRLTRLEQSGHTEGVKGCAKRIAKNYLKYNRQQDARDVILRVGAEVCKELEKDRKAYVECTIGEDGVKTLHLGKGSAFNYIHTLEDLLDLYHEFNIRDFDDEIMIQIREREPEKLKFMMPISSGVKISREKLEKDIAPFLTGTTEDILIKLIWGFIPNRAQAESLMNKSAKDYPLSMITPVSTYRQHSSNDHNPWLKEDCYIHTLRMSPADAADRGIKNGDRVRAYNQFGEVEVEAYVTSKMLPGTVSLHHGEWYKPDTSRKTKKMQYGIDTAGNCNFLIGDTHLPHAVGALLTAGLIEVEKVGDEQ